jgi:hypothetical protein
MVGEGRWGPAESCGDVAGWSGSRAGWVWLLSGARRAWSEGWPHECPRAAGPEQVGQAGPRAA